jgi:hypothetical protein
MYQNCIEVMKQALGALENAEAEGNCEYGATAMLRTAIKTTEQHEPVAWITKWSCNGSRGTVLGYKKERHHGDVEHIPLYTTPPQRQPLTEEEIDAIGSKWVGYPSYDDEFRWFAREIERKHGIGVDQ